MPGSLEIGDYELIDKSARQVIDHQLPLRLAEAGQKILPATHPFHASQPHLLE